MNNFRPKFYYSTNKKPADRPARRSLSKTELPKTTPQLAHEQSPHSASEIAYSTFSGRSFNIGQTLRANNDSSERDNLKKLRARRKKILRLLQYSVFGLAVVAFLARFLVFEVQVEFTDFKTKPDAAKYQTAIVDYLKRQPFERLVFNIDKSH